jgi:hypothetical protein
MSWSWKEESSTASHSGRFGSSATEVSGVPIFPAAIASTPAATR